MSAPITSRDVTRFWRNAGPARWFKRDAAFDAEIKSRFEAAHHAAATGAYDAWAADAEGVLALLVLLDQFPRNAWRGSGHMFATDGKALAIARAAVDARLDQQISDPSLRAFYYLPFMHSESLADQERSVMLNGALGEENRRYASHHRDIIMRFGRFPHRNGPLGRTTTEEEQKFLDEGGFTG
ncbi:DUF924 family protein [Variovorax sp. J22R133]|uniref:DUF924 family protein n=1 Tax=Variovorax brevis TaxID=3053503 RepID=UPI0025750701|nr:DUF924 family protein [Variovorax sp. J22R133]MDM0115929.1 DUF924 family protein [Variovorax sp. J22R133]